MKPDVESGCCRPARSRGRGLRVTLADFFESHLYHVSVIFLIALDLCLVITDIALSLVYCSSNHNDGHSSGEHADEGGEGSHGSSHSSTPHAVHITEEVLAWGSVGILSIFLIEFLVQLLVLGPKHFKHVAQIIDIVVVVVSLVMEIIYLQEYTPAAEVAALLVAFRLWRLVRILHATTELAEAGAHRREEEIKLLREDLEVARRQLQEAGLEPKWPSHRNHLNHHNGGVPAAGTLAVGPVASEGGAGQLSRGGSGGTSSVGFGGEGRGEGGKGGSRSGDNRSGGSRSGGSRSGGSSKVSGSVPGLRAVAVSPQQVGALPGDDGCS